MAAVEHKPSPELLALSSLTEDAWKAFTFDQGMAWLEDQLAHDKAGFQALSRSWLFWAWWRSQWINHDEEFEARWTELVDDPAKAELAYRAFHSVQVLRIRKMTPDRFIVEEARKEYSRA